MPFFRLNSFKCVFALLLFHSAVFAASGQTGGSSRKPASQDSGAPSPVEAQKTRVEALENQLESVRDELRKAKRKLQPAAATAALTAAEERRVQREIRILESEADLLAARIEAEKAGLEATGDAQLLHERQEKLSGADSDLPVKTKLEYARKLLSLSEASVESQTRQSDALQRAIQANKAHVDLLRDLLHEAGAEAARERLAEAIAEAEKQIEVLKGTRQAAVRQEELLRKQVETATSYLRAQEDAQGTQEAQATQPETPTDETATTNGEKPGEKEEELALAAKRGGAEAARREKEAGVLEREAKQIRELAAAKANYLEALRREIDLAKEQVDKLVAERASEEEIASAREHLASLEETYRATREAAGQMEQQARTIERQAREVRLDAEYMRRRAEEAEKQARALEEQRRQRQYSGILIALAVAVASVLLARFIRHAVERQEARTLSGVTNEERIRRIRTPFAMIRRIVVPLIYFVGTIIVLMQFETFRKLGTAFFASAGVAGIVVGLAARSTLANAVAGVMLCFSQPVRVGDTAMIGDEYGTIEAIDLMYTTFRTWDNRRIMIPNEIMSDKEIVNYTIRDQRIWAKVPIHLDYAADVEKARKILIDVVKQSGHWNGKDEPVVWFMALGEQTITLWAAAWAGSPPKAWQLKCAILDGALKRFKEEGVALPRRRYQYDGVRVTLEPGKGPNPEDV